MMRLDRTLVGLFGCLMLVSGCEEAPVFEADCENVPLVTGEITRGVQGRAVEGDLVVSGSAVHPGGLAIRSIEVGGIQAENLGFNFDRWSATIPLDQLQALSAANEGGPAEIVVRAVDVCDVTSPIGSFPVEVDDNPGVEVASLVLSVVIPGGESYIPATGDVPALLTIEGNAEAAGAFVQLTASAGDFQGSEGGATFLVGDGVEPSAATVFFSATDSGVAVITAASEGQLAQTFVTVAGEPTFIPARGSLSAGQTLVVAGLTEGRFARCSATPSAAFEVIADGVDLVREPQEFEDGDGDGRVDIEIVAAEEVLDPDEVTIICHDVYGQVNSATFTVEPGGGF